ncbi:hypothetical protein HAZT_HAZT010957 [Hyalella azteca]|nr:cytochrome b-c1 complex subunit 8 isoform X2 [Hyalella azteca]KAA0201614.1 hypothetical protein HAZT_HAZT010957 [Hyalella azteca]
MGQHWGELAHVRGIVKYSLSPFEQRPYANFFSKLLPNTIRRIRAQFFYVFPPFALGYYVYYTVEREHDRLLRKNPADYADEV